MTTPCVIACAITGSLPRKEQNPAVPITVAEQIESTHEGVRGGRVPRARARAQRRSEHELGSGSLRRVSARGATRVSGDDRAVLHRGAEWLRLGAWRELGAPSRHGLARHRLGELPHEHLREFTRPHRGARHGHAHPRHQTGGGGLRRRDALQRGALREGGLVEVAPARAVRARYQERVARRP